MSQQNNPFSKHIPDPRKGLDPKTITIDQLKNYRSHEIHKISLSWAVHRKSLLYIGGCLGLMLATSYIAEKAARAHVFGSDNRGGHLLDLVTTKDEAHYAYNREFQRMMVLSETHMPDVGGQSMKLITDLGVNLPRYGANNIPKRAPHQKYY